MFEVAVLSLASQQVPKEQVASDRNGDTHARSSGSSMTIACDKMKESLGSVANTLSIVQRSYEVYLRTAQVKECKNIIIHLAVAASRNQAPSLLSYNVPGE